MLVHAWREMGDSFIVVFPDGQPTYLDASTCPPVIEEGDENIQGDHTMEIVLHIEEAIRYRGLREREIYELAKQVVDECLGHE